ncbi:hypothetical protein [Streptomyces sp. WAC 06738]|uniref:hypothetical protein n=1 Tax=Streptomyces sp. WAC 06738 TaxID=2203210 RepID=UPI0013DFD090|nr:hypothetical protein [Streptomyces sp. WAC 06738]
MSPCWLFASPPLVVSLFVTVAGLIGNANSRRRHPPDDWPAPPARDEHDLGA